MLIKFDRSGTLEGFSEISREIQDEQGIKGLLILACDVNEFIPETLNGKLKEIPLPVFGGIFPEIIYGLEKLSRGTIVAGLSVKPEVKIIPDLSDIKANYDDVIDRVFPNIPDNGTLLYLLCSTLRAA